MQKTCNDFNAKRFCFCFYVNQTYVWTMDDEDEDYSGYQKWRIGTVKPMPKGGNKETQSYKGIKL